MIQITIDNGNGLKPLTMNVTDEATKAENEVLNRDLISRAETIRDLRRQIEDLKSRADRYETQRMLAEKFARQAEKWRNSATARTVEAVEAQSKVKDLEALVAQMEADLNDKNRAAYEAIVNDPGSGEVEDLRASNAELEADLATCRQAIRDGVSKAAELDREAAKWRNEAAAISQVTASRAPGGLDLQQEIDALRDEIAYWKKETQERNEVAENADRRAKHCEQVAERLLSEVEVLKATIAAYQEGRSELLVKAQQVNALTVEVEALETQAATLTEELKRSQEAKRKAETWAADERIATVEARARIAKLTEELNQSKDRGGEVLMEARDLKTRLIEQQRENDRLKDEIGAALKAAVKHAENGWLVKVVLIGGQPAAAPARQDTAIEAVIDYCNQTIAETQEQYAETGVNHQEPLDTVVAVCTEILELVKGTQEVQE